MGPEEFAIGARLPDQRLTRAAGTRRVELDAFVGQRGVKLAGDGDAQPQQEVSRNGDYLY